MSVVVVQTFVFSIHLNFEHVFGWCLYYIFQLNHIHTIAHFVSCRIFIVRDSSGESMDKLTNARNGLNCIFEKKYTLTVRERARGRDEELESGSIKQTNQVINRMKKEIERENRHTSKSEFGCGCFNAILIQI